MSQFFRSFFLAALGIAAWQSGAFACSCVQPTPENSIKGVTAIFSGTVIRVDIVDDLETAAHASGSSAGPNAVVIHPRPRLSTMEVEVSNAWKGNVAPRSTVRSGIGGTSCDWAFHFKPGEVVTVYAYGQGDVFDTNMCAMSPFTSAHLRASSAAALADYSARIEQLDRAIASMPQRIEPVLDKARFLVDWNDPAGARRAYAVAGAIEPRHFEAHLGQARMLFQLGQMAEARDLVSHALQLDPVNAEAIQLLFQVRLRLGDPSVIDEPGARGVQIHGLRFPGADLSGRDFSYFQLVRPDLSQANLSGANFALATLDRASLAGANLRAATLHGLNASGSNLSGADLSHAQLRNAAFNRGDLSRANLADTTGERLDLFAATTADAIFVRAKLPNANFETGRNARTDFADAVLDGANFRHADLTAADLSRASLIGARFHGARYDCQTKFPAGFDPVANQMLSAALACDGIPVRQVFDGMSFDGIDFSGLDLRNASFRGASFRHPRFWATNLQGVDFSRSQGASSFQGANLAGADFTEARSLHTFFGFGSQSALAGSGASLTGTKFSGAEIDIRQFGYGDRRIPAADLTKADLRDAILDCRNFLATDVLAFQELALWRRGAILGPDCARHVKNR